MSLCARVTSDGEHGGGEVRLERCEQRELGEPRLCMRESWILAERRRWSQEQGGSRMGDGGVRPPRPGGGGRRRDSLPSQYPPRSFPFILGLVWLTPAHRTGPCCCLLVGLCPQAAPAETREWEKAQGGCFFHDSAHPRLQAGAACRILPAALSGFPGMTPDPQSRRALAL